MKNLEKYVVIPVKYLDELSCTDKANLDVIIDKLIGLRVKLGKNHDPKYIVCKDSEPYASEVWKLILDDVTNSELSIDDQMKNAVELLHDLV